MPYTSYTSYASYAKMTDADLTALYHYLMEEAPAQAVVNKEADIPWPLNMRWPLAIWNFFFHDEQPFVANPQQSLDWSRGAYLVQGATHCGTCHTARGFAMQEKALSDSRTGGLWPPLWRPQGAGTRL